ncbi:SDR family oxidoreductase [Halolamina sp.]|jgi:NAD(P)-dependent dehydrogenase (short-subunit alcohol dehydrogenase family)|uniref:SDR family oxidoreductase n=1 Tax=Halolamina sp. TaxID=1940283 RepID=UPI000223BB83|nr:Estradiol 17-beta-dehydrogenase [halophilic archaeon DL31]
MRPETVLITGCSSGIGHATAEAFLADGWQVYATARDPEDIADLEEHGRCTTDTLDVTEKSDIRNVVNRIIRTEDRIDCLVNNAGYGQFGPIEELPVDKVETQFDVNVYGPHRLTRAVLPHMREAGEGTVINLSSVAGRISFAGGGAYCGSKFALEAMTDALRQEVEGHGIDAVLIEPGPVRTGFSDRASDESEEEQADRTGAYEWFWKAFEDSEAIGGDGPGSVEPEHVATDILDAANLTDPPARIPVGTVAELIVKARYLPASLQDAAIRLVRKRLL